MKKNLIELGVRNILEGLEVDRNDRNYKDTPARVARVYEELFTSPCDLRTFPETHDEMVVLRHHTTWGLCPHHLLPVQYDVSACYIPTGQVVGLSKIARIIDGVLDGPILQESFAPRVADTFMDNGALGAGCIVVGRHGCMQMRGVKTTGDVVTSAMRGALLDKPAARAEFLALVNRR